MFFQDGLTGSAWGDWSLYTASPLRAEPVSAAAAAAAAAKEFQGEGGRLLGVCILSLSVQGIPKYGVSRASMLIRNRKYGLGRYSVFGYLDQ